jgi:NAD(P)-dependent dehydrogenase (short-subunit alcohol dehydrogenase family)
VLGAYLCCRAVLPEMVERGRGRIINGGSGAGYLPVTPGNVGGTAYGPGKAALYRFGELVRSQMTGSLGMMPRGQRPSWRLGSFACWRPGARTG